MIEWILQNKEIVKLIYGIIVILICAIIVLKTNKLFKLSKHTGIRYFRNAFFFYGIGFFFRYILGNFLLESFVNNLYYATITFLFEFFMIMAGFFLLYSLIWRRFENHSTNYKSSLINVNILILYLISLILAFIDFLYASFYSLFISQLLLFILAFAVSFSNYISKGKQRKFLFFYFIAMFLSLTAWGLNGIAALILSWDVLVVITIYLINIIIFLIFLFGIINFTR